MSTGKAPPHTNETPHRSTQCAPGCFDLLTRAYMRATRKDKPEVAIAVVAGMASSVLGQSMSFPLETVARRLQASPLQHGMYALTAFV